MSGGTITDPTRGVVRGLGVAIVLVALVGVVAIVADGEDGVPPAGARVTVDGRATVVHLDGATEALETGDVVRAGEEVRVERGSVALELAGGGTIEGREGFGDAAPTRVVVAEQPELVAGELLVQGARGLGVDAAGTVFALATDGAAARIARDLSVIAAAYTGGLRLDSAGQERAVPALRQMGVASLGRPPRAAEPLDVRDADPWDRRYLGGAIDLGRSLDDLSRSFSVSSPGAASTPTVLATLLPALADEPAFAAKLAEAQRPAGEVLVGAAIAVLARAGSFAERWDETFGFREAGAGWGLVALDQRVAGDHLYDAVSAALTRSVETPEVAGPPLTTAPPGTTSTTSTTATPPTSSPPGSTPPTSPPTSPPTVPPPSVPEIPLPTIPEPDPDDGVAPDTGVDPVDDLIDPVDDLLSGLLE